MLHGYVLRTAANPRQDTRKGEVERLRTIEEIPIVNTDGEIIGVKNNPKRRLLIDVTQIKNVTEGTINSYGESPKFESLNNISNSYYAQPAENVNPGAKFSLPQTNIAEVAKQEFGTTQDMREAGYLLADGTVLDFSGKRDGDPRGVRYMDHREIARAMQWAESSINAKDIAEDANISEYGCAFKRCARTQNKNPLITRGFLLR